MLGSSLQGNPMDNNYRLPQRGIRLGRDARRSNRPITHFVCDLIDKFADDELESGTYECNNTKVECSANARDRSMSVFLHETNLMTLSIDQSEEVSFLSLSIGNRFTNDFGHPATTVVERMNGILDAIGYHSIIPVGVRLFKHQETNTYMIGNGSMVNSRKLRMGRDFAQNIIVDPDPDEFRILDYYPKPQQQKEAPLSSVETE